MQKQANRQLDGIRMQEYQPVALQVAEPTYTDLPFGGYGNSGVTVVYLFKDRGVRVAS
jgi:hypothetical protein